MIAIVEYRFKTCLHDEIDLADYEMEKYIEYFHIN